MINLGDKVTDCVTGFTGIAVERIESLTRQACYGVQARAEDNVIPELEYIDEDRLIGSLRELRALKTGQVE